jgi:hypothetical protein
MVSRELPLEARRAAWDRLWQILLAPPVSRSPSAEAEPDGGSRAHCPGQQVDTRCGQ